MCEKCGFRVRKIYGNKPEINKESVGIHAARSYYYNRDITIFLIDNSIKYNSLSSTTCKK